jgi:hypothetical protein
MLKHFSSILRDLIRERANEVETEVLMVNQRYQELNIMLCDVLDRIEQSLPPEQQELIFDLDEIMIEQDVLAYQSMYRQGVMDGLKLHRMMRWVMHVCLEPEI